MRRNDVLAIPSPATKACKTDTFSKTVPMTRKSQKRIGTARIAYSFKFFVGTTDGGNCNSFIILKRKMLV